METKHTPGPWKAGTTAHSGATLITQISAGTSTAGEFCSVLPNDCGPKDAAHERRHVANARLIAAAPEMADLLQRVAGLFRDTDAPLGVDARALLARIRGEG